MAPRPHQTHDPGALADMLRDAERLGDRDNALSLCTHLVALGAWTDVLRYAERVVEHAAHLGRKGGELAAHAATILAELATLSRARPCPECADDVAPNADIAQHTECLRCHGVGRVTPTDPPPNVLPQYAAAIDLWWPIEGRKWVFATWQRGGIVRHRVSAEALWALARGARPVGRFSDLLWRGLVAHGPRGDLMLTDRPPELSVIPECACPDQAECTTCAGTGLVADDRCPDCDVLCPGCEIAEA